MKKKVILLAAMFVGVSAYAQDLTSKKEKQCFRIGDWQFSSMLHHS